MEMPRIGGRHHHVRHGGDAGERRVEGLGQQGERGVVGRRLRRGLARLDHLDLDQRIADAPAHPEHGLLRRLSERDAQGLCAFVGTYCSDSFLGVCLTKKKVYCCFESKLSRILQEQGRKQLNKPWGKPKTEQCRGFTLDEFSRLDLSQMDFSEVYAEFTEAARLPDELTAASDLQQKIEDYYARASN